MFFVRLLSLPPSVEGVTIPNDDGTFDVYINSNLSLLKQSEVLVHEMEHIKKDHFYNDDPVWINEAEVE